MIQIQSKWLDCAEYKLVRIFQIHQQIFFLKYGTLDIWSPIFTIFVSPPQGSRISKICWELTKSGCHVQTPELSKKPYICSFKLINPITVVFTHLFWGFRTFWLATSISGSSFWLVETYFWRYFSCLAKSCCQNLLLAGNKFTAFPSLWSPGPPSLLCHLR